MYEFSYAFATGVRGLWSEPTRTKQLKPACSGDSSGAEIYCPRKSDHDDYPHHSAISLNAIQCHWPRPTHVLHAPHVVLRELTFVGGRTS